MNDAIAERLNRLEWANKKLTAAVAVLILGVMVAVGVGAARDDPRSIDAERLTLRDKGGRSGPSLSRTGRARTSFCSMLRAPNDFAFGPRTTGRAC